MSSTCHLTNIPSNEHIMLLYSNDDERNNADVNYINNGLKSGYHCIYASINAYDSKSSSNISNLSSKIDNYKENIESGELQIVDLSFMMNPHYMEIYIFNRVKVELRKTIRKTREKKILYNNYY